MLQPPSMSNFPPLFSNHASSTDTPCGLLTIEVPTTEDVSFSWSNFPLVQRDHFVTNDMTEKKHQPLEQSPSVPCLSPCSSDCDMSIETTTTRTESMTSVASASSRGKSVSFDSHVHVRTHSIVLGEHPCCTQLALELGWEYDDDLIAMTPEEEDEKKETRRRSYFERKAILKELAGMSDEEIKSTTLRHAAPSRCNLSAMQGIFL
eukprot:Nitzschia sp. Nitz4//scaffold110_size71422//15687//16304//NITZ4_005865-RA/size71422-processed-gene-0.55-mRNA-1//1//CDS//3329533062//8360//frame0